MFERLSQKLLKGLESLKNKGRITEKNLEDAIREVRVSLLDADVHFKVVKNFISKVKEKAIGQKTLSGLSAGEQFFNIVKNELIFLLGEKTHFLNTKGNPGVIFLVGLQGSGKTTTASKLAYYLKEKIKKKPGLVSLDVYRPAAFEQLKILADRASLPFFNHAEEIKKSPTLILEKSIAWAKENMIEVLLLDTAGRTQVDDSLMNELSELQKIAPPTETLLVIDAMLGQQSINVAQAFNEKIKLSGFFLTKIEGDARGGGAFSLRETTGLPIKFFGVGEKISDLEVFHPDRLVTRLLDQGDLLTLAEKAQEIISETEAKDAAKKITQKSEFTMNDFLKQIQMTKKMGGLQNILKMIPGMKQKIGSLTAPENEIKKIEAIIFSMTEKERKNTKILNASRRLRIAKGSGTKVQDVNKLIKQFEMSKKMMSKFLKQKKLGRFSKNLMKPF